jgi:hypothetical protein
MNLRRSLFLLPLLALPLLHCGDDDVPVGPSPAGDGGVAAPDGSSGGPVEEADKPLVPATKVDLLFAIDNSSSMGDKQSLLGTSVSRILRRLTEASPDHKPILDLHVGVISSSLGNQGGDVCAEQNPRTNDRAHLLNKDAAGNVPKGAEAGFLTFGPGGLTDVSELETAAKSLILGAGQDGCGFEAQLESLYRFLIQPDPPSSITRGPDDKVVLGPVDDDLLAQRKAFLRPDSAVAIVMLTDEDDSHVDPGWDHGRGWAFASRTYPGSMVRRGTTAQGTTAPRGTIACDTDPGSPDCISCEACNKDDACKAKQDAHCSKSGLDGSSGPGFDGYYGPLDDDLNVRWFHLKQRYGVDPQFPIDRYVRGLSFRKVPNRDTEHDATTGAYVHAETCTNPLFAAQLPASSKEEYCKMPEGARSRQLVMFQLIGGLPPALAPIGAAPNWTALLGQNPDKFDFTGIDPHMIQSITPRPGVGGGDPDLPRGQNGTDPVHGREWDTKNKDLQYACTVALPEPRSCAGYDGACDCADDPAHAGTPAGNAPLCKEDGSAVQTRAKAYPTIRELRVVKGLGDRGLAGSICAADPSSGYAPLLENFATKLSSVLAK